MNEHAYWNRLALPLARATPNCASLSAWLWVVLNAVVVTQKRGAGDFERLPNPSSEHSAALSTPALLVCHYGTRRSSRRLSFSH
jgi:hypothetical protein